MSGAVCASVREPLNSNNNSPLTCRLLSKH
jgi:hypothetical protein